MKNFSIKKKLLTGFLSIALVTAIVGGLGLYVTSTLSHHEQDLFANNVMGLYYASQAQSIAHEQRVALRDIALNTNDPEALKTSLADMASREAALDEVLPKYDALMDGNEEEKQIVADFRELYFGEFDVLKENVIIQAEKGDRDQAFIELGKAAVVCPQLITILDKLVAYQETQSELVVANDATISASFSLMIGAIAVIAVIFAVVLGLYISKIISTPTGELLVAARKLNEGNLNIALDNNNKDEVGELARAFNTMAEGIKSQADAIGKISEGDYTMTLPVRSEHDVMNKALNHMLDSNNSMISEIRQSSEQVASGSAQIASGAQALASGSSQQAATLQEFAASIADVQHMTEENNELALKTRDETEQSGRLMDESISFMQQMTSAMREINESSQSISKVIKVIDDIAFQTNILALNAAVEAARAGQHGKGFAVVADEVRNLASKSAAAAKETAALIESSVESVSNGTQIAERTSESLEKVGVIAKSNVESMSQLSESSERQSKAIQEINSGMAQISSVVQANSATAEESAASAEEMSAQSAVLSEIVNRFKLRSGAHAGSNFSASSAAVEANEEETASADNGFALRAAADKY